jgi:hypothetical protein
MLHCPEGSESERGFHFNRSDYTFDLNAAAMGNTKLAGGCLLRPNHHLLIMATHQTEVYTIWCVLSDEVSMFRIKVESDEPVIALKEKIKDANPSLAEFAAHHLKLYQVEISVHGDLKASVDEKLSQNPTELQAWPKLAAVFKEGLKDDVVHIIVQSPISGK